MKALKIIMDQQSSCATELPWHGDTRVILLDAVQLYLASRLVGIQDNFAKIIKSAEATPFSHKRLLSGESCEKLMEFLEAISKELAFLGCEFTKAEVDRFKAEVEKGVPSGFNVYDSKVVTVDSVEDFTVVSVEGFVKRASDRLADELN